MIRILLSISLVISVLAAHAEHAPSSSAPTQGGGFGAGAQMGGRPAMGGGGPARGAASPGREAAMAINKTGAEFIKGINQESKEVRKQISEDSQKAIASFANLKVSEESPQKTFDALGELAKPKDSKAIALDTTDSIVKGIADNNKVNLERYKQLATIYGGGPKKKPASAQQEAQNQGSLAQTLRSLPGTGRLGGSPLESAMSFNNGTGIPAIGSVGNNTGSARTIGSPVDLLHRSGDGSVASAGGLGGGGRRSGGLDLGMSGQGMDLGLSGGGGPAQGFKKHARDIYNLPVGIDPAAFNH